MVVDDEYSTFVDYANSVLSTVHSRDLNMSNRRVSILLRMPRIATPEEKIPLVAALKSIGSMDVYGRPIIVVVTPERYHLGVRAVYEDTMPSVQIFVVDDEYYEDPSNPGFLFGPVGLIVDFTSGGSRWRRFANLGLVVRDDKRVVVSPEYSRVVVDDPLDYFYVSGVMVYVANVLSTIYDSLISGSRKPLSLDELVRVVVSGGRRGVPSEMWREFARDRVHEMVYNAFQRVWLGRVFPNMMNLSRSYDSLLSLD